MGKAISPVTDLVGLTDTKGARQASKDAQAQMERGLAAMRDVPLPDIEKMRIALEEPELIGELVAESLGPSQVSQIKEDPRLREVQMRALASLEQRGREGLTEDDRLVFRQLQDQIAADEQARQASIQAQMEQQGLSDSGTALMAKLSSNQAAAQRAQQQSADMAKAALENKRNALTSAAQTAAVLGQGQFERDVKKTSAADAINQFNLANRQNVTAQNLANRQRIAENKTNLRNEQQMFNKQLEQQQFENAYRKAGGMANAYGNASSFMSAKGQAQAQADQASLKEITGMLTGKDTKSNFQQAGANLSSLASMFGSDENLKKDIEKASEKDIQSRMKELVSKLQPYMYEYKEPERHGKGKRLGILAQDLEKSELGKEMVQEDSDGNKMVDAGKLAGAAIASTKSLSDRLDKIEKSLKKK